ncbi:hypothetical protein Gotur_025204 [Gossypium turneri]
MDAIHTFAREGKLDNLLKCIESGVSMHLQDSEGRTPMHWAVDRGHLKIAEALLIRNADVNAKMIGIQTGLPLPSVWEILSDERRIEMKEVTYDFHAWKPSLVINCVMQI